MCPSFRCLGTGDVHTGCGQFIWADLGGWYSHFLTSEILQLIISDGRWTDLFWVPIAE
uniref:Uncharacterized protein n=1 Tax=Aegilops tauschii subsp. strangulata TaxID=200361 RepID=A0A452XC15_AEGTS